MPLSIAVGIWASTRGRSGWGWFFLCLLISPLIAGIILAVSKNLATGESTPAPGAGRTSAHSSSGAMNAAALFDASTKSSSAPAHVGPTDDDFAAAMAECDSAQRKPGVWAKAFTEALGDEVRSRALYTGRRAGELAAERIERERVEQLKTEEGRLRLEREAYEAKPKGTCPNCDTVVLLDAESCPSQRCGATFTAPGGWRVKPLPA
ncbi:hypothetical protein [Variovorax sp. B2]|uniref:hypothetical protein n=1 Tax=Variovorax sp. B2 TaxID=2021406 RepID=UPI000B0DB7B6|nr:hypothetical protein [Variovorax sp. B2]